MSFVSTFAPTGYAAGLLLAAFFTGSGNWRAALLVHGTLLAIAFLTLLLLVPAVHSDSVGARDPLRQSLARMLSIFREPRALRLGIAVALPNAVSYGTSIAAPSYAADWFEVTNIGGAAVDVTGWKMDDNSNSFALSVPIVGLGSIGPGVSAILIEGTSTTAANFVTAWFGATPNM